MSQERQRREPQVVTLSGSCCKLEGTSRGKNQDGSIKQGLILRRWAGIGDVEDGLNDHYKILSN